MRVVAFKLRCELAEVELMMAFRGVQLSYEAIRRWCDTFGSLYAAKLKRRRPKLGDKWFPDEVFSRSTECNSVCGARWINRCRDRHPGATEAGSFRRHLLLSQAAAN